MKRLTVLYLIRTWALGGPHTIILTLLKHLPADRFTILCVPYATRSGNDKKFEAAVRAAGHTLPKERIPWHSRTDWWRARRAVAGLIETYGADLVHTHDPQSNVIVGLGRKRWPCACVASAYGWWARRFPLRSHVYQWFERNHALPAFDRVITVSRDMQNKILVGPTPPQRVRVVRTGLDSASVRPGAPRQETRRRLGLAADACVVGTVSRLYIEKGHCHLLSAAARLRERLPGLRVLIVGDGPLRAELEAFATRLGLAERVVFAGFYDDLYGALGAMDVFVQPSILDEGLPTSVLEAQAAGLPVVASDTGGTAEALDVGKTGLLVPPAEPEALATLVEDGARRRAMGDAARAWVARQFPLQHMIDQVAATYTEAVEHYRGTR